MISCSSLAQDQYPNTVVKTAHQIHCLTEAVYHEARGEPLEGQAAVARVVMNRAKYPKTFGDSICKVVYQKRQFSWSANEKLSWTRHENSPVFLAIEAKVVIWMLADEANIPYVPVDVSTATFFSNSRPMAHNLLYAGAIGHHDFYYNKNFLPAE